MNDIADSAVAVLTSAEQAKRDGLRARKPYVAAKLARIAEMEERGDISPIVRLEKSYLCNFQCSHCSAEFYMDRHLERVLPIAETPYQMDLDDVRRLSREADELGLARFVITGGEPLVMKDFDAVVEAIDPDRHYVVTDTNGWFLDNKKAHHLKSIGVEKVQLSLDSFIEADHDRFRNKPGSYRRVMRAIDASLDAGLNLILSTVLVKGRAKTEEFEQLCRFCTERGIGLYVSYAKPTGACSEHPDLVIDKADADVVRELERRYSIFTHMTPSYGSFKGCITVKGIITVTSTMEVKPCPYIDFSLGNLRQTSLKEILARGMRNPWLGPYRPDCLIGEDADFIRIHAEKTDGITLLPVPWGEGFSDHDRLPAEDPVPSGQESAFDEHGRCRPHNMRGEVIHRDRGYFSTVQPAIDYDAVHRRSVAAFGADRLPDRTGFRERAEAILNRLAAQPAWHGLLGGVRVPFLLPQAAHDDIGEALEKDYLPRVASAYQSYFPHHRFVNHLAGRLAGRFAIVGASRHDRLVQAMAAASVVGWFFPCLGGYSIPATIERIGTLPAEASLAGGYDTCSALIGSPDLLIRHDGYPPLLWLGALTSANPDEGFHFEAYGHDLTFNRRLHFGHAAECWNCGLVIIDRGALD